MWSQLLPSVPMFLGHILHANPVKMQIGKVTELRITDPVIKWPCILRLLHVSVGVQRKHDMLLKFCDKHYNDKNQIDII